MKVVEKGDEEGGEGNSQATSDRVEVDNKPVIMT